MKRSRITSYLGMISLGFALIPGIYIYFFKQEYSELSIIGPGLLFSSFIFASIVCSYFELQVPKSNFNLFLIIHAPRRASVGRGLSLIYGFLFLLSGIIYFSMIPYETDYISLFESGIVYIPFLISGILGIVGAIIYRDSQQEFPSDDQTRRHIIGIIMIMICSILIVTSILFLNTSASYYRTVNVSQDAYVYEYLPDTNYGQDSQIYIGNYEYGKTEAYYHFDLSSLESNWKEAKLLVRFDYASNPVNAGACIIFETWDELSITWNNKPNHTTLFGHIVCDGFDFYIPVKPKHVINHRITICLYGIGGGSDGYLSGTSRECSSSEDDIPFAYLEYKGIDPNFYIGYIIAYVGIFIVGLLYLNNTRKAINSREKQIKNLNELFRFREELPQLQASYDDTSYQEKSGKTTMKYFKNLMTNFSKDYEGFQNVNLMGLAFKAYEKGDFEKTVSITQQILRNKPKIEFAWYVLLESLSYLGREEDMVAIGEEAIRLHPNFGPNYLWLADAYEELGDKEKALIYYKKAVIIFEEEYQEDPNDDNVLNSLGGCYLKLENFEASVKYNKKAIKINPKSEHHLHNLGRTYMKMGLYNKAIKYLEESLKHNSRHSYSWFDLGLIYEELNQLEKAIKCFEKAVKYSPQWVKLREKLISLKPDSPILIKPSPITNGKAEGDKLYDILSTRTLENRLMRYEAILERLLYMEEGQLIVYLKLLIQSYEKRIIACSNNKKIPRFYVERLTIQKEFKQALLKNLRDYPNYITKFRRIIENEMEFYRMISSKPKKSKQEHLEMLFNLLLELPYEQLTTYFRDEIVLKKEMLKYKPMDGRESEIRALALNFVRDTLKLLEENRANIQGFRKEIRDRLEDLNTGQFFGLNEKFYYLF